MRWTYISIYLNVLRSQDKIAFVKDLRYSLTREKAVYRLNSSLLDLAYRLCAILFVRKNLILYIYIYDLKIYIETSTLFRNKKDSFDPRTGKTGEP